MKRNCIASCFSNHTRFGFTKHHAMKTYGGVGIIHVFLTSALVGDEWSASRLCRFTLGERATGTHWIALGGPQGPSERYGDIKIRDLTGKSEIGYDHSQFSTDYSPHHSTVHTDRVT
jgi:hypothetical protein